MNAEVYAEWLRRQGHRVIRTESSHWHSRGLGVFQAFPYHREIDPPDAELSSLLAEPGLRALRYALPERNPKGCESYAIVFEEAHYDLERMGHRTRKNVRRGLRNCTVKPISFERMVDEGWELRQDTLSRQNRDMGVREETWRSGYLAAADLPGLQAWGAYVGNDLAAYLVWFQMDDCISIVDQQSHRRYLDLNVNNALTYVITQNALSTAGIRRVFYGVESLDAPARVSEFKFHMGYIAKPIRQRVLFGPQIALLANPWSYKLVSTISRLRPADRRFSKAKGMLRFCLAEKYPEVRLQPRA